VASINGIPVSAPMFRASERERACADNAKFPADEGVAPYYSVNAPSGFRARPQCLLSRQVFRTTYQSLPQTLLEQGRDAPFFSTSSSASDMTCESNGPALRKRQCKTKSRVWGLALGLSPSLQDAARLDSST
jgi:hypothetical protein